MNIIHELIDRTSRQRRRIAVLGDIMRDEFLIGQVPRISPEAPVPVFLTTHEEVMQRPGGAANVNYQLKHWNVDVKLLGLVDAWTSETLDDAGIDSSRSVYLAHGRNPVKRRYMAEGSNPQVVLRHDVERPDYGEPDLERLRKKLLDNLAQLVPELDVVVLSDYAKGLLTHDFIRGVVARCSEHHVPVVADHKRRPLFDWRQVSILKMNAIEAEASGVLTETHTTDARQCGLTIVTRGARPPLIRGTGEIGFRPAPDLGTLAYSASESGAGDCFTAHLAIGKVFDMPPVCLAQFAHLAGRVYVRGRWNRPVLPLEVLREADPLAKMATAGEVRRFLDERPGRLVFTNGVFRLLHPGHVATLDWARRQGDVLVVGVNDDASAARVKPGEYCLPLAERAALLAGLASVDWIVPFSEDTPESLMTVLRPDVLVKGPEFYFQRDQLPGAGLVGEALTAPQSRWLKHARDWVAEIKNHGSMCNVAAS